MPSRPTPTEAPTEPPTDAGGGRGDHVSTITASLVKELRDATGAGMMACKQALAGDRRRPRGRPDAAARAGHGLGRQARRPRDDRGSRRLPHRGQPRHDGRDRLRDRAGLEERRVPGLRRSRCSRPSRSAAPDAVADLEDERVELTARLGENIVVTGAERYEAGDGEVARRLRASAGEQDRRARQARRRHARSSRGSSRCTSPSPLRSGRRRRTCRPSSSRPRSRST